MSSDPATQALQSFSRGDFAACLRHLSSLPATDPRVEHNRALAELMSNDLRGTDKYRSSLARLLGVVYPRSELPGAALRRPTLVYNYGVVLFHARHYRQAGDVLQRLTDEKIEDVDLKRRVVLLSVEVCLCRRLANRALEMINTNKRLFEKDCLEESAMLQRQSYRARLLLGERVEVSDGVEAGVEGLVLRAHAELVRGDLPAAAHTLATHTTLSHTYNAHTQGEDIWPALNNNLGVIQLALNKPALAAKYFQTAVKEQLCAESGAESGRLLSVRDRPLLVYNLGLALLRARRTAPAFDCLVEAARHFPANPRIWRRLAECCVRHVVPDSTAPAVLIRYGSGAHVRLAVSSPHKIQYSTQGESFAIPNLSLEFAALCLRNALALLKHSVEVPTPAAPGAPLPATSVKHLRNVLLTLHSYVLLKLQEPLGALQSCAEVCRGGENEAGEGAEALCVLRRVYSAEALVRLERLQEAADQLHPAPLHNLLSALPPQQRHQLAIQVWATAAACHMVRGDTGTARKILSQLESPRALPLRLYLELVAGDMEAAQAILRNIPAIHTQTVH